MSSASNDDVRIRLEGLTKRYPGQRSNAVDALDLDIRRGEVVVLVGPSGCGKTTTMKMINRIIEPSGGRILLDGVDTATMTRHDLRAAIGMVLQDTWLFKGTIRDNIAYGSLDASDAEIESAAAERGKRRPRIDLLTAPSATLDAARESLGAAIVASHGLPDHVARIVADGAQSAFLDGSHVASVIAAVALGGAAVWAACSALAQRRISGDA